MKITVYNQEGKETGQVLLPEEIFNIKMNSDLVHQVAVSQMANKRQVIAHTKDRGEVRGGGKKPWRQKGTGRARHGSIRSPLWKGGGVTFGPTKERVFSKKIPKKMRRKALLMVLSSKANDELIILDNLKIKDAKTKLMGKVLQDLSAKFKDLQKATTLLALPGKNDIVIRAAKNISKIHTIEARELNVLNLLSSKYLLIPEESIEVIKKTFLK